MNLTHKILNTINNYGMLEEGDRVLVAVSGGPDSVFLLHILNSLKDTLGIELCIAHMDHGIRGLESRRDAQFVRKLGKSLGVKLAYKRLTPKRAKSKLSLEERLREKRYNFFKKAAMEIGSGVVATAHTLDDQAETVLMRIIKGASLGGIVGIHPVRIDKDIKFIRPLIEIEKNDIVTFLKERRIPYKIDSTNLEDKFFRNKIRHRILPYLAKVNPRIKRSLFNLANSLREDFEFIKEEKRKREGLIKKKRSFHYIKLCDILLQPKAIQREIAKEAFRSIGGNIKKLTFRHWKDIDNFVRTKQKNKSIDLPGGVKLQKTHNRLVFTRAGTARWGQLGGDSSVGTGAFVRKNPH